PVEGDGRTAEYGEAGERGEERGRDERERNGATWDEAGQDRAARDGVAREDPAGRADAPERGARAGRPGAADRRGPGAPAAGTGDAAGTAAREPWPDLLDYLATGSLIAAGVLAALGRERRRQLWRRAFGHRIPRPQGDAADAEVALRLGSDAPGSRLL